MNPQNHEDSARRLEVADDLSPIFVRELDTAFVSKSVDCIGNVARRTKREEKDGKESYLVS